MKILKEGKLPEHQLFRVTCSHCKTEFEFERHEGRLVFDQRDGDFIEIECPTCSTTRFVYKSANGEKV